MIGHDGRAIFRTVSAWGAIDVVHRPEDLVRGAFYVVVMTFEGCFTAVRMAHTEHHVTPWGRPSDEADQPGATGPVSSREAAPAPSTVPGVAWSSSLDQEAYENGVRAIRSRIAAGDVYQANLCRVLHRPTRAEDDLDRLFSDVLAHNPAPYACRIDVPQASLDIVSASPELFLERDGATLRSSPIKGTATSAETMLAKDTVENIMITDLVRNDLQRVCEPGSVVVESLLAPQEHPGLVHLVSTVAGRLRPFSTWPDILAATSPPGSVSGAPKSSALAVIAACEAVPRGPYCGAIGWIDTRDETAELSVGIRTFWRDESATQGGEKAHGGIASGRLMFGTGAGITWGSDPLAEWRETELKARRLLAIADGGLDRERR